MKGCTYLCKCNRIFKEYGVCYLELWCLPYWNPTCQLVVDPMHCILEGLMKHHICNLLGLAAENTNGANALAPAFLFHFKMVNSIVAEQLSILRKQVVQVSAIHVLLTVQVPQPNDGTLVMTYLEQLEQSLLCNNSCILKFVCQSLNSIPLENRRIFKVDYAKALVSWVGLMPAIVMYNVFLRSLNDQWAKWPLFADEPMHIQYDIQEVLGCIHHVICNGAVPPWLVSVSSNFSKKAASTTKADEWHTLATVYLPIALISLWEMTSPQSNIALDLCTVCNHTIDLVSTVYLACVHTTSDNHATAYQNYISYNIENLKIIYPTFNAQPNHPFPEASSIYTAVKVLWHSLCNDNLWLPVLDIEQDSFSMYLHFPATLYSLALDSLESVHLTWIVGHFIHWAIMSDRMVVLSLCWVSVSLWHSMSLSFINLYLGLMCGCVVMNVLFFYPVLCVLYDLFVCTIISHSVHHDHEIIA